MAIELQHLHPGHDDELSRLKARIAELEKENAELRENHKKATERDTENWNRLCVKYNKLIDLHKDFCEKFKDIELEIDK